MAQKHVQAPYNQSFSNSELTQRQQKDYLAAKLQSKTSLQEHAMLNNLENKKDTEVAALLSADMKDEKYYENQVIRAQNSPRYRGFVESNMESKRVPKVGPIGLPETKPQFRRQTLIKGKPVNYGAASPINSPRNHDELQYLGEESVVQKPKPANHANMARQRVQKKTSEERVAMERAHNDMNSYLNKYNDNKMHKQEQQMVERKQDMQMLKEYNPFGKPGGGAPMKTTSGRDLPQWKTDFEIRFKDNEYNKKMVEVGKRYKTGYSDREEYKRALDTQVKEKINNMIADKKSNTDQDLTSMRYNPFGKPGAGAPRSTADTYHHWSKLEPQPSTGFLEEKRNRLKLQAKENLEKAQVVKDTKVARAHKNIKQDNVYNPWGKGYGNPKFDNEGNVDVKFGMKTHYDIFNKIPIVTTHSGQKIGGWPLPIHQTASGTATVPGGSTGDNLHSFQSGTPQTQPTKRGGLLSRYHDQNFVTDNIDSTPPMLNGREAKIVENQGLNHKTINDPQKHQTHLVKVQNQSIVLPQVATENPSKHERPSAGTLKRELDANNKSLNLKINENYAKAENHKIAGDSRGNMKNVSFADLHNTNLPNKKPEKDVADWMRSTILSHPRRDPQSGLIRATRRQTSDVTKHRLDLRTPCNSRQYHDELSQQVREKRDRDNFNRQSELNAERNWDNNLISSFGKPGAGAPSSLGTARRQFSNPSLMPQTQVGTSTPSYGYDNNVNSLLGGVGHGAPHNKGTHRRMFSNAALVPQNQLGTNTPKIAGDKPTSVASLLRTNYDNSYYMK